MTRWSAAPPARRRSRLAVVLCGAIALGGVPACADQGAAAARIDYLLHCSGCHRPDGAGAPPEVPSLRGPIGLIVGTPEGRDYVARVPEAAQAPLEDDELARVLNWILREFSPHTLPDGFRPLDAEEVGAARGRVLADPLRERARLAGTYERSAAGGHGR